MRTFWSMANLHRRNVYDSLNRLKEKGFVFEIVQKKENIYEAVDPRKLMEHVKEKEHMLAEIMPGLEKLYKSSPTNEAVCIYKGIEGWKNYLNDVLTVGEDVYTIGGKGAWGDQRLESFMKNFTKKAKGKGIKFHALYEGDRDSFPKEILQTSAGLHKFLPKGFYSTTSIDVFGDHVVIISDIVDQQIDDNATLTVIINKSVAESFKLWFKMIWTLV